MNGIDFMVRDRTGWVPNVPPPAPFLHPEFETPEPPAKGEPLRDEHIDYINAMRGLISVCDLAEQFHISRGTVSNIWKGLPSAGKGTNRKALGRFKAAHAMRLSTSGPNPCIPGDSP